MTQISGKFLRTPQRVMDKGAPESLKGAGITLAMRAVKEFVPTGAPVHLFDVLDSSNQKIGHACLILEPDTTELNLTGHLSVNLLRRRLGAKPLEGIARLLMTHAFECGVQTLRIVIPVDKVVRVKAAVQLRPSRTTVHKTDTGPHILVFDFDKKDVIG